MKTLNSLTTGTLHSPKLYQYKTKDGNAVFTFSYEQEMGYYDIVIHDHPGYGMRDDSSSVAHWLPCDSSPINKKVCFMDGKEPTTLQKAQKISMQYAELTWNYILSGVTIDDQLLRRN